MRASILIGALIVILVNSQEDVARNSTSFSDSIRNFQLKLLYHTSNYLQRHLVMAPFSVWAQMAVLSEGTAGPTNTELRMYIGKYGSRNFGREGFANVTQFFKLKETVTVERTSSLFYDSKIEIRPGYASDITKYYGTAVEKLDMTQPRVAAQRVNDYFKAATHGRIGQVLSPQDLTDARLILTETLYFKGRWGKPFKASATTVENFYNAEGQVIGQVNMMYQRTPFGFSNMEKLGGHVLELPYGDNDRFVMLVMLPYHGVSIVDMYKNLGDVPFPDIFRRFAQDKVFYGTDYVDVWLPRFSISTDVSLMDPLVLSSIVKIFTKEADFSRMTKDPTYVTSVIHKAEIEVTEEGTVASAVSGVLPSHGTVVPKFRANRPFIFLVLEKMSKSILFSGIYSQPSLF